MGPSTDSWHGDLCSRRRVHGDRSALVYAFLPCDSWNGSWKRTGERTFLLTYLTLNHDTQGTFQGTSKIRQIATLNEARNAYSGSGNFDVYDVHGNVILSGTFTIQATRFQVETP